MAQRVALLLSGLPRMWQPSLATQLDMFRDYDTDVFFHFWDTIDDAEKDALLQLTRPKAYRFQAPQDFSDLDRNPDIKLDNINVPSRLASQYYSWKAAASLFAADAGHYDFAMRSGSDLQFVRSLGDMIPRMKKGDLILPWWETGQTVADFFAFGEPETILYYCSLYDHLLIYAKETLFNPEILLIEHLSKMPVPATIRVEEYDKLCFLRRPHMANYSIEQCLSEDASTNKWLSPEVVDSHRAFHTRDGNPARAAHFERFCVIQLAKLLGKSSAA